MSPYVIQQSSVLRRTSTADVWALIIDWDQVNRELWPLNMTHDERFPTVADIPADGRVHFVSRLRIGWLPIDLHRLAFREISAPERFHECSSNLLLKEWTHNRSLRQVGDDVVLEDSCTLSPRLKLLGPLLVTVYRWVFGRRHRRLRRHFAAPHD